MKVKIPLTIGTIISFFAMVDSFKVFMGSLNSEHSLRILMASLGLAIFLLFFLCCVTFLFKEFFSIKR